MTRFVDVTRESGIDFVHATPDYRGGGLAVADLDGDGLVEIVAGQRSGGLAVYRNRGSLRFGLMADIGLDPSVAVSAIAAVDLDNDGDRDLVLAGPSTAYIMANRGDATFDETARFDASGTTEQVLPVDLDGDGLLDLYFSNRDLVSAAASLNGLYMNRGGARFTFAGTIGRGLSWSTTLLDIDGDLDQDLYVANDTLLADFGRPGETSTLPPDLLLRNDGPGADGVPQLVDIATTMGLATPRSSMGGVLADFNDDAAFDLFVPNLGAKKLFLRDPSEYVERAALLGIAAISRVNRVCGPDTEHEDCLFNSWSAVLTDFDVDGHDELVVANGEAAESVPPVLMFTRDADLLYHEVSSDLGCVDGRGIVATDLDGDGDQDVVIAQARGPLVVYRNLGAPTARSWLRVTLRGVTSNREGIGAVVTARLSSGRTLVRMVGAGGVINTSSPAEAYFGLGTDTVESVEVRWPSGQQTELIRPRGGAVVIAEP
jgi:hypothetical protein